MPKAINRNTGLPIVGSLERVLVQYPITDVVPDEAGGVDFFYAGEEAEVFWDTAEPVVSEGGRVFIDEDGEECNEDEIDFVDEEK